MRPGPNLRFQFHIAAAFSMPNTFKIFLVAGHLELDSFSASYTTLVAVLLLALVENFLNHDCRSDETINTIFYCLKKKDLKLFFKQFSENNKIISYYSDISLQVVK